MSIASRGRWGGNKGKKPPLPGRNARNCARPIPTEPGMYFWDAYGQVVEVYKKKGSKKLYVTPPIKGGIEIPVTPRIAGTFVEHKE